MILQLKNNSEPIIPSQKTCSRQALTHNVTCDPFFGHWTSCGSLCLQHNIVVPRPWDLAISGSQPLYLWNGTNNCGPKVLALWGCEQILLISLSPSLAVLMIAKTLLHSLAVFVREESSSESFFFIPLNELLRVGDKNITNCLASARGTMESLRKSLLATTRMKADYSRERQHSLLREFRAGAFKFLPRRGAQPGATYFNCSLLSCEKWEEQSLLL
jgi:hypothetical protein